MRGVSDRSPAADSPGLTPDFQELRKLSIVAGVGFAILFVVAGLLFQFQLYGDSGLFAYAVAVQDSWAFHWHNISNRSTVYLYAHLPAEIYGSLTGDAWAAIQIYGLLFLGSQLLGLVVTYRLDKTPQRDLFVFACLSNALLCPLIFGAPSEMWVAHALFWPALAAVHCSAPRWSGIAAFVAFLPLAFAHEGALIFVAAILISILLRKGELRRFAQCLGAAAAVFGVWLFVRYNLRPDEYTARVLSAAASNVFNPEILLDRMLELLVATAGGYLLLYLALRRAGVSWAAAAALIAALAALAVYWLLGDHEIHTESRYFLRTVVIVLCPLLAATAVCAAFDTNLVRLANLSYAIVCTIGTRIGTRALSALLLLTICIHVVETARFAAGWTEYLDLFRTMVSKTEPQARKYVAIDPDDPKLHGMPWFSTLPYLSVLVAPGFKPERLAIDPRSDYFWISCANATRSVRKANGSSIPAQSREMIRDYNCRNRP